MFAVALAFGLLTNACPMRIGITRDGTVFSDQMHGWYKTSQKTLARVVRGGCYNDSNPSEITSVKLEIAPNAPRERIDEVYLILKKEGWPKERLTVETWTDDPREPR
jgi:hypothetical protein